MPVRSENDIVAARQFVRKLSQQAKFSLVDQTKFVTAASEIARNTLVYGGGGDMHWEMVSEGARTGVRLRFDDQGPGIPDIGLALTDGWTSGKGLGLGLSGSKRLVNEFDVRSAPGQGTSVTIARWK
ncbi:anti-sigma regulatory factor [Aquincola agrisoli]